MNTELLNSASHIAIAAADKRNSDAGGGLAALAVASRNPDGDILPAALAPLRAKRRWVVWRWETRPDGKRTKVPYNARHPLTRASSANPQTWSTYNQARAAAVVSRADGVGYCLSGDDIAAFDLDDCVDPEGNIAPWASELIRDCNSYVERTVSGTGLRVLGTATGPKVHRSQSVPGTGGKLETFRQAERCIVVTGNVLDGYGELRHIDRQIDTWVARLDRERSGEMVVPSVARDTATASNSPPSSPLPDRLAKLVCEGCPEGERSQQFHHVVGWLKDLGYDPGGIETLMSAYPGGIAAKYFGRLRPEIERSYARIAALTSAPHRPSTPAVGDRGDFANDAPACAAPSSHARRPEIRIVKGRIKETVDAIEQALITQGGLYQRGGRVVRIASQSDHTSDIVIVRDRTLAERVSEAAVLQRFDVRSQEWVVTDPPPALIETLAQRQEALRLPVLNGIISAPALRPDLTLVAAQGYDPASGLYVDLQGLEYPEIALAPSRDDATRALATLSELLASFPFIADEDRSVALSAIITACVRRALPGAPLHAATAPVAGSGKTHLFALTSYIATGGVAPVISQPSTDDELEKRLSAALLDGASCIAIDNCDRPVDGTFLCAALTQTTVSIRPLGVTERVQVPTSAFLTATGNNLVIAGDMTRRAVVARLDPQLERPELRTFAFDPLATAMADRPRFVTAALTIVLAYRAAGAPSQSVPLASFEGWSRVIRDALLWLGCADPVDTMERAREGDPRLQELDAVLTQWRELVQFKRVSARQLVERAMQVNPYIGDEASLGPDPRDLHDALFAVAGVGSSINVRRLGRWLASIAGRRRSGLYIAEMPKLNGITTWCLTSVDESL